MMTFFQKLHNALERFNNALGKWLSWFIALMAAIVVAIVLARALFNIGSIAVQESVNYLHSAVFLLLLAYAAQKGTHVRVDVFYRNFSEHAKSWVNAIGAVVFLLPFAGFLTAISWQFVANSWAILEVSGNSGGLPAVFILKTFIPISGVLLGLYALSQVLSEVVKLTFKEPHCE